MGSARRRSLVLQTLLLVAMLAAVAFLIAGLVPGSGRRLDHPAIGWIAAEVIVELAAIGAYVAQFHDAFSDRDHRLKIARSAEIAVGELGAFIVVPTGAGGPALRFWALLRGGMPFRQMVKRVVVQTTIFNLPYLLTALVLGTTVALGIGRSHAPLAVALAPLGVAAAVIALVAFLTWFAHTRPSPPERGWRRIAWQSLQAVPDGLRELPRGLRRPVLVLGAAAYWGGDCGVLILAFHAAHGSAPIDVIVPAYMLGQLGNTLPLPGGVGGVEPIMLGVLTASGVGAGLGGAAIVFYRLVSLGIQATAGTIATALLVRALGRPTRDGRYAGGNG
jgi:uncharacterized membrane protein YbhN (UPF0104 family)